MNDQLSIKPIVVANVTGAVLGAAKSFDRAITSRTTPSRFSRINTNLGSTNPTYIDIAHVMPASPTAKQQSLFAYMQTRSRVDVSSNILGVDSSELRLTLQKTAGITESEAVDDLLSLTGALLENNAALFRAWFNGQA